MGARSLPLPFLLIVAIILPGAGFPLGPTLAQGEPPLPSTAEAVPGHLRNETFDMPRLPSAAAVVPDTRRATLAPEYAAWSRLVFQSLRNQHDWDIYTAAGDGANQVRLTSSTAADLHPRLNRGATRVAFASKRDGNYEIYAMSADGSGQTRLTRNGADDVNPAWSPDGGRIAFQAYRDGQAEIYVMNADGSGQARLTNYGDYDGEPAWSPDGSQIAFTRRQDGKYRIWVMNPDGSNAHQLSNQTSSESPAWSPDGSRIAYDADGNGDGWQELWLMDVDGGNQRQVYDPPEADTDAWARSWSPDGRYIAFTRISLVLYQGNWYWTTAYLDAWDSRSPGNVMRLSSDGEDWNPDWRSTDIWAPTSAMQPMPARSPSPFFVGWSGNDVGPAGVDTFDIQVKDGAAGTWTDWVVKTYNTPLYYLGLGGHTHFFRTRARDNAGNLEPWPPDYQTFTTVESLPPTSAIQPLPAYTWQGNATMTWDGRDPGGSGIRTFDLQCRDGAAGAWQACGSYSAPGSAAIPGAAGHTIYLRSRATDFAGNVEAWPPGDDDTHTTLYTGKVNGVVRDNAGAPIVGVTVAMTPTNFITASDAPDGSYQAYTSETAGEIQVALSKAEYGGLPTTALGRWPEAVLNGILPPAGNQVRNWGFEAELLPAWEAGGVISPALSASARHTGERGVALGWPDWPFTAPANISNQPGSSWPYASMSDDEGRIHVVWGETDPSGTSLGIRYAQRAPDGKWAKEPLLAGPNSGGAQMATDQNGALYVVWSEYYSSGQDVFLQRRAPEGNWSSLENVSRTPAVGSYQPWIGLDDTSMVHVIWSEGGGWSNQIYHAQRSLNGVWTAPVQISAAGSYGASFGSAAVSVGGEVAVVWTEQIGGGATMFWAYHSPGGAWSCPEQLGPGDRPRLVPGPDSVLHLLWTNGGQIRYARRMPAGLWSPSEIVPVTGGISDMAVDGLGTAHVAAVFIDTLDSIRYTQRSPGGEWSDVEEVFSTSVAPAPSGLDLAAGTDGTIYLTWRHRLNYYNSQWRDVYFARRETAGHWSAAKRISENANQANDSIPPLLTVDGRGGAHIVWSNEVNYSSRVFHVLYTGNPTGDAWLRQQLTIPAGSSHPGLSFLYQLHQDRPVGNNPFSVIVEDAAGASTVFSSAAVTADWEHRWVDLAPWQGSTVTLTFLLQNTAGDSPTTVYLDEATVGSTLPDTWLSLSGPPAALPGQQVGYTITCGNRGGVTAGGARVTLHLPPELAFASADPPPSATTPELTWDVGDLAARGAPQTIRITVEVSPGAALGAAVLSTAGIASDTSELEEANNTAQATMYIGHLIYLPIIAR